MSALKTTKPTDQEIMAAAHERIQAERGQTTGRFPLTREQLELRLRDAWDTINDVSILLEQSPIAEEHRRQTVDLVKQRSASRRAGGPTGRVSMEQALDDFFKKPVRP